MRVFLNTYLTLIFLGVLGLGIVTSLMALRTGVQLRDQLLSSASETYITGKVLGEVQMYLDRYERLLLAAYFSQQALDQFVVEETDLRDHAIEELARLHQQVPDLDAVSRFAAMIKSYFDHGDAVVTVMGRIPVNHPVIQHELKQMLELEVAMHPEMREIGEYFSGFEQRASEEHDREISRLTILTVVLSITILLIFALLGWLLYLLVSKHSRIKALQSFPEHNPHPVMSMTTEGHIVYANPASYHLIESLRITQQGIIALLPENLPELTMEMRDSEMRQRDWIGQVGHQYFQYRMQYLRFQNLFHLYMEDVTERERIKNELIYRASHDPVTRLYNRFQLYEDLPVCASELPAYLLLIQFHGYEDILSSHGQNHVDMVSAEVAERINVLLTDYKPLQSAYRWADEVFGLIASDLNQDRLMELMEKIQQRLARPYGIGELEFLMRIKIAGTAVIAEDPPGTVISRCQTALRLAPQDQKIIFYHQYMGQTYERQRQLEKGLETALEREQLSLYFQPQVSLVSGLIVGAEALLRWHHPEHGEISPTEFIPVAEATGAIIPIGDWVLRQACQFWQALKKQALIEQAVVAVNLSANQFRHTGLLKAVEDTLTATEMAFGQLELEITESHLMHDVEASVDTMIRLRQLGVALAIDDFGTGYSSLASLSGFPLDKLKIDRSFIIDIPGNRSNESLVLAIIQMAHALNLKIIAEGVESEVQLDWLRKHGSNEIQGYYFSRPLPRDEFVAFIQQGQTL